MEKYYEYSGDKNKCKHNIVVQSCRQCLFETLCRLGQQRNNNTDE